MSELKVILKITLNEGLMKEKGISVDQFAKGLRLYQDDVADGFQLTTCIEGVDATEIYFLLEGRIETSEVVAV